MENKRPKKLSMGWLKRVLRFIELLFVKKDAGDKVLKLLINTMRKDERD